MAKHQYTVSNEHWGEKAIAHSQCFSWKMHSHYNDEYNLVEVIFKQNFSYKSCLFLFLPTHCPISLVFLVSLIFCSAVCAKLDFWISIGHPTDSLKGRKLAPVSRDISLPSNHVCVGVSNSIMRYVCDEASVVGRHGTLLVMRLACHHVKIH